MSTIAFITLTIAIGAVLGILLGQVRYRGVGLGIGGVLFSGIFVGHFAHELFGLTIRNAEGVLTAQGSILSYVQEFGLILFVYAIGVQVGPSFFATLRGMGVKLIGWAVTIVLLGATISMILFFCGIVPLDVMIGMYSGGVTNTPALGAGTQMINDMAEAFKAEGKDAVAMGLNSLIVPSGYAVAYPFAVCSLLIVMVAAKAIFSIDINKAGEEHANAKRGGSATITAENVEVLSEEFVGKKISDIPGVNSKDIVVSRLKRNGQLSNPSADTELEQGDIIHIVGLPDFVNNAAAALGHETKVSLTTHGTNIAVRHIIITNDAVMGRTLASIDIEKKFGIVISRIIRAGVQFMPNPDFKLALGDELNVVGKPSDIAAAGKIVGNSSQVMHKVAMLPIFLGLFLGILLGNIPIPIPGVPAPLKLGLAGGPLIMAILLSRFGDTWTFNHMHWRLPAPALSAFREMGITLFLTIVGICAGANGFWATLTEGDGLSWMAWATLISFIPIAIVGFLAIKLSHVNYLTMCGMLAGSYTDPPALAYANGMYKDPEAASLGYATVYPFVMFLRILTPQIMVIIGVAFLG